MGEAVAFILTFLPTVWEIWNDRNGETKKDKAQDAIVAIILYAAITLICMWMWAIPPVKSLSMMLAIRVMLFDYIIHYILIQRGVIVGNWFTYTGKTSTFDKLIAKINPWIRLLLRVAVFAGAVWLWFEI